VTSAISPKELQSTYSDLSKYLRLAARYIYSDASSSAGAHPAPSAILETVHDRAIFRLPDDLGQGPGELRLQTITLADQLGSVVQQVSPHESCLAPVQAPSGVTTCDSLARWVTSGITLADQLGRPVAERYPFAIEGRTAPTSLAEPADAIKVPESSIAYDGLDRRLGIRLPDGNGYSFKYSISKSINVSNPAVRHRTEMQDALCTPSAIERDVRGAIRTVVEGARDVIVEQRVSAALGSSAREADEAAILGAGLVGSIRRSETRGQQIYECKAPTNGSFFQPGLRQTVTAYDRDVLGQLVAVRLPERSTATQPRPSRDSILVTYDGLGRRTAVDDPDRGYERLQYDMLGNAFCRYIGARRGALTAKDGRHATFDQIAAAVSPIRPDGTPTNIAVDPAACPDPKSDDTGIMRITRSAYLAGLPLATAYRIFDRLDPAAEKAAALRSVRMTYGVGASDEDRKGNRVGRAYRTVDASGSETRQYDGLGRLADSIREYGGLASAQGARNTVTLVTQESRDVWGLLASRTFDISMRGYATNTPPRRFQEHVGYNYTLGGQIAEVLGGSGVSGPLSAVADNFRYDERGNLLGHVNALGIATSDGFDQASNRLVASRSVIDLGDSTIRPLAFQNLTYQYDPAGNVAAYANTPAVAGPCFSAANENDCGLTDQLAKAYGMMIKGSRNEFSYDQLNRLRTATKVVDSFDASRIDTDGNPQVISPAELTKARALRLRVQETFAFEPTHEMSVLARSTETTVAGKTTTRAMVSRYTSDQKPRHAPGRIDAAVREGTGQYKVNTTFGIDDLGRMTASLCERSDRKSCSPDRYFEWNADDTMSAQTVEIPSERLPAEKRGKGFVLYDFISSDFDSTGRRTRKELREQSWRPGNNGDKPDKQEFVSETLYADSQLTIMRRPNGQPEAIVHYFAGPLRIASRWVGDDRLFTYHAHLLTRNITDIAVGRFAPGSALPKSARIHGQQEYAAFGEIIHERENLLAGSSDGQTARSRMGLVHYRFNAKEQDESGLQDFGARFYDNRLALWARPDPVLHDYLDGRLNGGVFTPRNLASYGFGWGNPASFVDVGGRYSASTGGEWQLSFDIALSGALGVAYPILGFGPYGGGGVAVGITSRGTFFVEASNILGAGVGTYGGVSGGLQLGYNSTPRAIGPDAGSSFQIEGNIALGIAGGFTAEINKDQIAMSLPESAGMKQMSRLFGGQFGAGLGAHISAGKKDAISYSLSIPGAYNEFINYGANKMKVIEREIEKIYELNPIH
jgi:RHS repeat-associated protein